MSTYGIKLADYVNAEVEINRGRNLLISCVHSWIWGSAEDAPFPTHILSFLSVLGKIGQIIGWYPLPLLIQSPISVKY